MTDKDGFWLLYRKRLFCNTAAISEMCILTSLFSLNKHSVSHAGGRCSAVMEKTDRFSVSQTQLDFLCSVKSLALFKGSVHFSFLIKHLEEEYLSVNSVLLTSMLAS